MVGGLLAASASLVLGGCATKEYVDQQVAGVQSQVTGIQGQVSNLQGQVAANSSALSEQNARIAKLDSDYQALAKADQLQGTKLAEETVHFRTGSARLSSADEQKLADLANRLKTENKPVHLEIHGYTDSTGREARNERLGASRADSVFAYLGKQGFPLNSMQMMSHGEDNPAASNDTSDGRAQNRRVVVSVLG
jgi:outer membrane protein OmpA-like peptidoglycan-associated protein